MDTLSDASFTTDEKRRIKTSFHLWATLLLVQLIGSLPSFASAASFLVCLLPQGLFCMVLVADKFPCGAATRDYPNLGADLWPSPCWSRWCFFWLIFQVSQGFFVLRPWHSACPLLPNLLALLNLLRMYSVSSYRLSMKILNNIGLTIDPSCALLFTSHQLGGKPWVTPFQPDSPSFSCLAIK